MREVAGDLWGQKCDALVITTNGTVKKDGRAVMGRGVAKQAAQRYVTLPLRLGKAIQDSGNHVQPFFWEDGPVIVAFPVKHNWWQQADLALIERSCHELVELADRTGWKRAVLPRPGCGNGGLSWDDVGPVVGVLLDKRFTVVQV